eukprot:gene15760-18730_t
MYFQITDAKAAVYRVQNLPDSVELLAQTTLRNIIATLTLDDTFSSRDIINSQLREKTTKDAERWGVTITRVEVMSIKPPKDIKMAMEMQIQRDREKRSAILNADGERESQIVMSKGSAAKLVLLAEAQKTVSIQAAKGEAEAKRLNAYSEAELIKLIRAAINNPEVNATDYLISSQYLDRITAIPTRENTNIYMVPESSLNAVANFSTNLTPKISTH